MNEKQKKILKIVAFLIIGMLLFPPFHTVWKGSEIPEGYSFIFYPPRGGAIVDKEMLLIQLLVVSAVGGIAFIIRHDETQTK